MKIYDRLFSSRYPIGTVFSGIVDGSVSDLDVQYIRFSHVLLDGNPVNPMEMRVTTTLSDFLKQHGYDGQTVVGHEIHFVKKKILVSGYDGEPFSATFFVPRHIK